MLIRYARISTNDQNLDLQIDALKSAGCTKIHKDIASGAKDDRMGLSEVLKYIRTGDALVVWKLDRLGRSLKHLIDTINQINSQECYFRSLQENIDTSTSGGKLIFHIFGALAEFERDIIRDRTKAGQPLSAVSALLGHSNTSVMIKYYTDKDKVRGSVAGSLNITKNEK